jgi:hypothetical protein
MKNIRNRYKIFARESRKKKETLREPVVKGKEEVTDYSATS